MCWKDWNKIDLFMLVDIYKTDHCIEIEFKTILQWKANRKRYQNQKVNDNLNALTQKDIETPWLPNVIYENNNQKWNREVVKQGGNSSKSGWQNRNWLQKCSSRMLNNWKSSLKVQSCVRNNEKLCAGMITTNLVVPTPRNYCIKLNRFRSSQFNFFFFKTSLRAMLFSSLHLHCILMQIKSNSRHAV